MWYNIFMKYETLAKVMGNTLPMARYQELHPHYENAMRAANITNVNRAAMFAAQLRHESVGLKYMEEIASGSAYEGRSDLENIYPGDGVRFKGRGPIQLTGRKNYRAFTQWANANGYSNIDFEAEPTKLSEPKWGFLAASYYWVVSRPNLNKWSDEKNVLNASREINGWVERPNGLAERTSFFNEILAFGTALLPGDGGYMSTTAVLDYPRDQVAQDTYYNCGPASAQTVIRAKTGNLLREVDLGAELKTHEGGTDWIGQFPAVFNKHMPGAEYRSVEMPNDPPTQAQKDRLWDNIKNSIDAGYGVVANIVAQPSNYPRAVAPSTISPAYRGGTVYHYIAIMGYDSNSPDGIKAVWVADSGFDPFGYWMSFDQLATLIPPKGYAYSTATPIQNTIAEGLFMSLSPERQEDLANKIDRIYHELTHEFQSRYEKDGVQSEFRDTLVGYELEGDRKVEDIHANMLPEIYRVLLNIQGHTVDRKGK
ncbi:lysin A [Corynebacterium phage Kimchi1738]|uniref:Lysin A n=1 Tax=Corynebacterium phage Kimchi1738 TaxID=2483719 RepID=A0A3G3LWH1_9CAUD|nr:endolysin [Corynebacterium phage Kimchi1738]AYQ98428.1 lysin A [Corynebacterium phage Kimchi1738]